MPTVRPASVDDAEALLDVINRAYEVEKFFIPDDRISPDGLARLFAKGTFLVGEDDWIAACVYVEIRGPRAYFGLLAVNPDQQGRGWGRRMVEAAEAHARAAGCAAMDIRVVNLRTELRPFYRKLGYSATGTEPLDDPRLTQPAHFVLMSKVLDHSKVPGPGS